MDPSPAARRGAPPALMSYGMALLDEVNTMAERSPGFVWRMQARGNSTDVTVGEDRWVIVNLTVWESADHLFAFTYRSDHRRVFARPRSRTRSDASISPLSTAPPPTPSRSKPNSRLPPEQATS